MAIVAIQECSAGNESVGNMWLETHIFNRSEPIANVLKWADSLPCANGRLIIRAPDNAHEIKVEKITSPNT